MLALNEHEYKEIYIESRLQEETGKDYITYLFLELKKLKSQNNDIYSDSNFLKREIHKINKRRILYELSRKGISNDYFEGKSEPYFNDLFNKCFSSIVDTDEKNLKSMAAKEPKIAHTRKFSMLDRDVVQMAMEDYKEQLEQSDNDINFYISNNKKKYATDKIYQLNYK